MHRTTRLLTLGSALALASFMVPPAVAADSGPATADGLDAVATVDATSPFYAGYAATGVGSGETSAVFRVPDLTCTDVAEGFVITVYAISEEGDFLAGPDLFAYCSGGEFVLDGHVTTSGGQIPIWQELVPGDKIKLAITAHAEGTSTHDVSFSSVTRDWTSVLPTNSPVDRIEIAYRRISLDGERVLPPDFGRDKITNVQFDGVRLAKAEATRTNLVDDEGDVLVKATKAKRGKFRLVSKLG